MKTMVICYYRCIIVAKAWIPALMIEHIHMATTYTELSMLVTDDHLSITFARQTYVIISADYHLHIILE
jgi:hypothetical protein